MLRNIYSLILLLLSFSGLCQNKTSNAIDLRLTVEFKKMIAADSEVRCDSLSNLFSKQLSKQFLNFATFSNKLDSLSNYINIISSKDDMVKFYSWDDQCGGTWHSIRSLVQFIPESKKLTVQELSLNNEMEFGGYTDCNYYKVDEILFNGRKHYLTFAWGTHGNGMQFNIIQIFSITGNRFLKCKSCIMNQSELVLEYERGKKLNLQFNNQTNEITYNELKPEEARSFAGPTGNTVILSLNDKGYFRKK